jgi:uncharacterized PurR-regulated membrane protein YhhQ (DUF165 family)
MLTQTSLGWTSPQVLLGILAMAVIVAASNYLVTIPVTTILGVDMNAATGFAFSEYVQWAAFSYPIAFLVTDVMNRVYGPSAARRVIAVGFVFGVVLSLWLADPRIAFASGTAFLVAQLMDVSVFNRMRDGLWWKAPLVSSIIAGTVDSALFWTLAFYGSDFVGWWNYALVDWAAKVSVTVLMLVPFRALTWGMRPGTA